MPGALLLGKYYTLGKHLAPRDQRRPSTGLGRLVAIIAALVVFVAAVTVLAISAIRHQSIIATIEDSLVPSPQTLFARDRILVLLVGKDYDYNEKDEEYSSQARSDVIKAISLDFVHKRISELAVPRDMDVILPNGAESKINQALSDGGIREAQAVVAKFLGIPPFDRYVILRINSAKEVVNALGGVNMKVSEQLDYDDTWGHLHIHFHPGNYHMNGEQAVSYARFRHDACGDPCRIRRQQQVERAIINALRANKLQDLAQIQNYIGIFQRNVDTNLSTTELVSLAVAFQSMDPKNVRADQVPYTDTKDTVSGGNVLVADENAKQALVRKLLLGPPPAPSSPQPVDLAAISPSSVKVDVKNGTGIPGQGRRVADLLAKQGFVIGDVATAERSGMAATEIYEHTIITFAGAKVRASLGPTVKNTPITSDALASPVPSSDVTVVVGKDLLARLTSSIIK
ncbi:MAG: hypothetical protein DLM50_01795 [Candidatus Meridianibacter frigidus]|nr:MAG: hypothetical protein DLM50_01795 [Candidatus Eremiobacteraeota bacterium]